MKRLVLVLWCAALGAQTAVIQNPHSTAADVAAGAKTFRSHCAACHGFNGEGGRGPNLTTGIFYHGDSDADLLKNISDGIAGTEMPGLFYSPDRVWQVIAYVRSLHEGSRGAVKGDARAGEQVYRAKGCAQCHRVNGEGGRLGPDLTEIGKTRSAAHLRQAVVEPNSDVRQRYWLVNLTRPDGKKSTGFLMNEDTYTVQFMDLQENLHSMSKVDVKQYSVEKISKMPSFQGSLTGRELDDLVAYLISLRPKGVR